MRYLHAYIIGYGVETGDAERGPSGYYTKRLIYAESERHARRIVEDEHIEGFCGISEVRLATIPEIIACTDSPELPFV